MSDTKDIALVDVPAIEVLGTKKKGTYTLIPELLMNVYAFIQKEKITIVGPPVFLCHETSPQAVMEANEKGTATVEVAWPITGTPRGSGDIRMYHLPGGTMVHAVHKGPYDSCEPTYLQVFAWIENRGLRIGGPIREVYPNDPQKVRHEDIITDIYVPVQ